MRQNKILPDGSSSSSNVPIWTISEDLNSVVVVGNNEKDLPSYENFITSQSANLAIVPDGNTFDYSQIIPYTKPSNAKIERKDNGISSSDLLINRNSDQLWLYFLTYLKEKPRCYIRIIGYHYPEYPTYHMTYVQPYGDHAGQFDPHPRMKTDFRYSIDLTPYISEYYSHVNIIPDKEGIDYNENISLKDLLEQYIHSKKQLKEISCVKQLVGWNFDELKTKIEELVLSAGYKQKIQVDFSFENGRIAARSSSILNRCTSSIWTFVLCFISCFWLIYFPIYWYFRDKSQVNYRITANYKMLTSMDIFLQRNAPLIFKATSTRSRQRFVARIA